MIFVDVETTGLDSSRCAILSIGAVEFENPSNKFYIKCAPWKGAALYMQAFEVNGFDPENVWRMPNTQRVAIREFDKWAKLSCRDGIIAGHNFVRFDDIFIKEAYRREFNSMSTAYQRILDIMTVYQQSDLYNYNGAKLNDLLSALGLPPEPHPHHALRGAMLELEAYSRLVNRKSIFRKDALYGNFRL